MIDTALSVSDAIGNFACNVPPSFKSHFEQVSCSGDSVLLARLFLAWWRYLGLTVFEMELAALAVLLDFWSPLEVMGASNGNGVRFLPLPVTCSMIEVPSMCCLRTFGMALVVIRVASEPSFLKCFEVGSL
ncbi:hypothetical protein AMTR_s00093p00078990 [Amborella trichopoda]|uniref:Uncharacterized protein n=1 Tax=Amborella trichopoda TaxID=13333 RepID=W1NSN7_AMBTC|nr:hypothetical protein AMTR_s00093p00078990 [Amborella trichopoda]